MKSCTFLSILVNQRDILFVRVHMSVCHGACWEGRVEEFCIYYYKYGFICLGSNEFVLMDEYTFLFHTASAFKREVEDCKLTCKDKYSLCEMRL